MLKVPRNVWFSVGLGVALAALDGYANADGRAWGDWLATVLFAYYAIYCTQNFARCREVHCAFTAPGFAAAAMLMLLRVTGLAHYAYSVPWAVFVASACVGYCIQWAYESRTGSIFLGR